MLFGHLKMYLYLSIQEYLHNVQQVLIIEHYLVFHHFYRFHSKFALEKLSFACLILITMWYEITSCMYLCSLNFIMNNVFLEGDKGEGKEGE